MDKHTEGWINGSMRRPIYLINYWKENLPFGFSNMVVLSYAIHKFGRCRSLIILSTAQQKNDGLSFKQPNQHFHTKTVLQWSICRLYWYLQILVYFFPKVSPATNLYLLLYNCLQKSCCVFFEPNTISFPFLQSIFLMKISVFQRI